MEDTTTSLEQQLEDYLEQKEFERIELENLISTPPYPLYRGSRRAFDTDGTSSTAGTFAWNAGAYTGQ